MHLEKVLAFVELCVPLGPLFDRLPRAEFDEATATPEQIVQQALFEEEFLAWAAKDEQKDSWEAQGLCYSRRAVQHH